MLSLDVFKLVVLCTEHVDICYNSRVPKMVKGVVVKVQDLDGTMCTSLDWGE